MVVRDEEAIRVAGQLLPWINRSGSTMEGVERAVRQIERAGSPAELELHAARGELVRLEAAWREAEEIGSIADDLLIPERVRVALSALRGAGRP